MQKRRLEMLMTVGLAALLLCASPMFIRASDQTASVKQKPAVADEANPKSTTDSSEQVAALKQQMALQQKQIEQMQKALEEQKQLLEQLVKPAATTEQATQPAKPAVAPVQAVQTQTPNLGQVASTSAMVPKGMIKSETAAGNMAIATLAVPRPDPAKGDDPSPLQLKVGDVYITPVGFMDFTSVFHNHAAGGSIGTNFASVPYATTSPVPYQTNLSELRLSMQNSRIGFRMDAQVHGAHVLGYMESDFLGNNPTNVAVSSNSNTMRSRVYFVDVTTGNWEVLGGQTWSLLTPGRVGISPIPGNLFYTQVVDVNYQAGLFWGRIPELRVVYHPSKTLALAVALDSPDQYAGGSAGGPLITLPTALNSSTGYQGQLDYNGNGLNAPNLTPDIIFKLAYDPTKMVHFEIGGLERNFRVFNPVSVAKYSSVGGGGFVNFHVEPVKGFRLFTNNFWSDGGGRYIFGQAPDLIARADGSISPIKSMSTVSGFEVTQKKTMVYAYYGGVYVARNTALDANGTSLIGYGYRGASTGQNRAIQEATFGFNQTLWKDAKYGAINFMGQFSYVTRNPWSVVTGQPSNASLDEVFFNLRYTLPGSAPTLGK